MNPTILYYNINEQTLSCLRQYPDIVLKEIKMMDGNNRMGALLDYPGFHRDKKVLMVNFKESFLYFASMSESMVFEICDLLKAHQIYIPFKSMQTPTNLNYTFNELSQHILLEYQTMKGKKNG